MKTAKKVILIIFIILFVIIAALGIWQKDNIESFVNSLKYSGEELSQKMGDNNKKMDHIVETTNYLDVRKGGLTAEEEKAVVSGEISREDAVKIIRGQTTLEKLRDEKTNQTQIDAPQEAPKNPDKEEMPSLESQPTAPQIQPTKEEVMTEEVSNIVAELYVVKADFIAQLEAEGQKMYNEYIATRYDPTKIMSIVDKYLPTVASLEAQCDSTINGLLSRIETALKEGGGDLSLVTEIRRYYYKEKSLKKSYYLNLIYENSK